MNVYLAEFIGTALLLLMGGGVVANVALKKTNGNGADWIVITVGWGLGVTLGVYAVGQISGAHLNPAVTLALAMNGDFAWAQVPGYIIAQLIGGVFGGMLTWLMYLPHWRATEDKATKLGVFATAVLTSGLLYIGANKFTDGLNPLIVGALIVAIGLSLGGTTGYAINPARDLGPRIAHAILPITGKGGSGWGYAIVPILGPMVGGMLGAVLYRLAFKGIFDVWTIVTLIALVLTLLLGVAMNKKAPKDEIAKI